MTDSPRWCPACGWGDHHADRCTAGPPPPYLSARTERWSIGVILASLVVLVLCAGLVAALFT